MAHNRLGPLVHGLPVASADCAKSWISGSLFTLYGVLSNVHVAGDIRSVLPSPQFRGMPLGGGLG